MASAKQRLSRIVALEARIEARDTQRIDAKLYDLSNEELHAIAFDYFASDGDPDTWTWEDPMNETERETLRQLYAAYQATLPRIVDPVAPRARRFS